MRKRDNGCQELFRTDSNAAELMVSDLLVCGFSEQSRCFSTININTLLETDEKKGWKANLTQKATNWGLGGNLVNLPKWLILLKKSRVKHHYTCYCSVWFRHFTIFIWIIINYLNSSCCWAATKKPKVSDCCASRQGGNTGEKIFFITKLR